MPQSTNNLFLKKDGDDGKYEPDDLNTICLKM